MSELQQDAPLVQSLEEYIERAESGECPDPQEYEERLGSTFPEFLSAVRAKDALQVLIEPATVDVMPEMVGSYTLIRPLGRGALGVVYEARHRRLDRLVALKLLHDTYLDDEDKLTRFRREARICASFEHDNLVPMYDAGRIGERPYCAMQLIDGRSLKQVVADGPMEPNKKLFREFAGLADGLATMHASHFLHRDVKPSNIMVDKTGHFVLTDFGLARSDLDPSLTGTGNTLGTLPYLAPELLRGSTPDSQGRADVYALGASLYEALSGQPAFVGSSPAAIIAAVDRAKPTPLRQLRPELSGDCERVVRKAMERRPEDRYATAAEFRDDLLRLAEGNGVLARPVSAGAMFVRRARPVLPWLGVAALLLTGFWFWQAGRRVRLTVDAVPAADVWLDGKHLGRTPLEADVEGGVHILSFKRELFQSVETRIELTPGAAYPARADLVPLDTKNAEALSILLAALRNAGGRFTLGGARTARDGLPLWPRGTVRRKALSPLVYELPLDGSLSKRGKWTLRSGDKVLWSRRVSEVPTTQVPDRRALAFPFPADILAQLKPGDRLSWGFEPPRGEAVYAECELIADTAEIERVLLGRDERHAELYPLRRALARADAYGQAGMHLAALREMEPFLQIETVPARRAMVYGVIDQSLRGLGLGSSLQTAQNLQRIENLDASVRSVFFFESR